MITGEDIPKPTSLEDVWQTAWWFAEADDRISVDVRTARGLNLSQVTDSDFLRQCAWAIFGARRLELGATRLHDARHTHASLMLKQGIHPKVVQERLGHASIQTTLDTYSHVAPGLQEAAALRFDEAFNRRRNTVAEERVS